MSGRGLYVYGVVPTSAAADLDEALRLAQSDASSQPRLVECRELVAVLSDIDLADFDDEPLRAHLADQHWVERLARHHERVLDTVIAHCTPIPMRLCTVYRDERGLKQLLLREYDALVAGLRDLRDRLEWGVKAFAGAGSGGRQSGATTRSPGLGPAGSVSGTAYLQGRIAERQAKEHAQVELQRACENVHAELCAVSVAAHVGAIQRPEVSGRDEPMVLNAYFLVANAQRDAFLDRLAALREKAAGVELALELTGPWPPYNFVPEPIGGGL